MTARPIEHSNAFGLPTGESECPICEKTKHVYQFVIHGLRVVRCSGCQLLSLDPQPVGSDLGSFYGESLGGGETRISNAEDETEQESAHRYLALLSERVSGGGRVLLIAPPNDPVVSIAQIYGFQIGEHISISEMERSWNLRDAYDAALVLYQLEKAANPSNILKQIHSSLKPDGLLLLSTPSLDSWPANVFSAQWTEWRPENRFYFGRLTAQSLLLKSGFCQIWIEPEVRSYTLQHIYEKAISYPRTSLTQLIRFIYRCVPPPFRNHKIKLTSSRMLITAKRSALRHRPLCSIIVPAYNESETFVSVMDSLLAKQLPGLDKQIIVVESNSTDGTRELAQRYASEPDMKLILQEKPQGKGNAVRQGFQYAEGDIILIQDADLEYDLNDYEILIEPLLSYRSAFVLGTRHRGSWKMRKFADQELLAAFLNCGHFFFAGLINLLYGQRMSDPFTMFKVFRRDCLYGLDFECNRFDFDHELVIKLVRKGYIPLEIPINYVSRSFKEGKKVNLFRDPWTWLWVDIKYRFTSQGQPPRNSAGE